MAKALLAVFSASGRTLKKGRMLAEATGADIYQIKPAVPYTTEDLDWKNLKSRSSIEMQNREIRPEIINDDIDLSKYDTILLAFPIWWYVAPTIVNTFLENYDLTGKKIVLYATSGGSGFGNTMAELEPSAPGADMVVGGMMNRCYEKEMEDFADKLSEL